MHTRFIIYGTSCSPSFLFFFQDGDFLLCESAVVAEYLAAKFGPSKSIDLFPQTPKERALSALFISQEIDKYTSGFYALLRAQTPEAQAEGKEKLLSAIASISAKLAENGGPFVLGDRLTLADIYFFPFVHRLLVLEHYRNFTVPNDAKYEAFHRFAEAMRNHPGVAATLAADDKDFFIEAYTGYANP